EAVICGPSPKPPRFGIDLHMPGIAPGRRALRRICPEQEALVEHCMIDHSAFLRSEHQVDLSVACLNCVRIREVALPLPDITPMRKGLSTVRRERRGQGRAVGETV